jgi:hypothetical protein
MPIMAGVLGQLFRPQKEPMYRDPKIMELETAKEILAEVFNVRLAEVDEMIHNRFQVAGDEDVGRQEIGSEDISVEELWPQEFSLGEC